LKNVHKSSSTSRNVGVVLDEILGRAERRLVFRKAKDQSQSKSLPRAKPRGSGAA
jgi:hypothetical protein